MNKMERKFGRYAIPNLMYYIVILYAVGVLVQMMAPAFYIQSFLQPDSNLPLLQSGNDSGAGLGNLPV